MGCAGTANVMLCAASLPRLFVGALAAGVRDGTGVATETERVGVVRSGVDAIGAVQALAIKIAMISTDNRCIVISLSPEQCN